MRRGRGLIVIAACALAVTCGFASVARADSGGDGSPMAICQDLQDGTVDGSYTEAQWNAFLSDPTVQGYCNVIVPPCVTGAGSNGGGSMCQTTYHHHDDAGTAGAADPGACAGSRGRTGRGGQDEAGGGEGRGAHHPGSTGAARHDADAGDASLHGSAAQRGARIRTRADRRGLRAPAHRARARRGLTSTH